MLFCHAHRHFKAAKVGQSELTGTSSQAGVFIHWIGGLDWTGVDWTHPKICKMPFSV